ncbi:MAG: hypothetical protein JWM64_727 [Frankiales bacterium]|nr:hypothetical protein [Frankiales bacterium]
MPAVLRPRDADAVVSFVRAARPLARSLLRLTGPDPQRITSHWRNEVAVVAAAPGLGGRLASAAQGVVAAGAQGTLVVALCLAADVTDEREQVRVVAAAVLERALPERWSPVPPEDEDEAVRAAADEQPDVGLLRGLGTRLVALGRVLNASRRVVGGREEGRLWHRTLGMLPVVGAAGALLGERHALEKVSARARAELV